MSDAQNSLIAQFVDITQTSPSEAHELLAATGWELEAALSAFYSNHGSQRSGTGALGGNVLGGGNPSPNYAPPRQTTPVASGSSSSSSRSNSRAAAPKKKFASFADLNSSDDTPQRPDNQNLFTGGEKSGLAVQPRDRAGQDMGMPRGMPGGMPGSMPGQAGLFGGSGHIVNEILRQAQQSSQRQSGDAEDDDAEDEDEDGGSSGPSHFSGRGFTLGSDEVPSQPVGTAPELDAEGDALERVSRRLIFWHNGFSIEDGPLYRYDDPANQLHLQAINAGRAPLSLLNVRNNQRVDVHIEKRMDRDYEAPRAAAGGFHGSGNRLGAAGVSGAVVTASAPVSPSPPPAAALVTAPAPSAPVGSGDTNVVVRLADGRSIKCRVEGEGEVQQLYDVVESNGAGGREYVLQTTFPNRQLTDRSQSVKASGAAGAVVVQRWV